ncbi:hypothetical protein [Streptococcus sp. sy004]|uniref:hypothetical protein n=1 Tax=Streptococcus sp. sy004 TaxID=2600149 RepID=UPI001644DDA5|nr:hypothetical protein [Streptococcus sp. sy004]
MKQNDTTFLFILFSIYSVLVILFDAGLLNFNLEYYLPLPLAIIFYCLSLTMTSIKK